jgi:hypothetical protein
MPRVVALLALFVPALAQGQGEGPLHVGLAEADITPDLGPGAKPVWMAGFGVGRKATGVADRLFARAVVLRHGKQKVAIVSLDVVGLFNGFARKVRKRLPGFAHVTVTSTHNHEGPDTLGIWGPRLFESGVDPAYMALLEKRAAEAVSRADKAAEEAEARIGIVRAPELLHDSRKPIVLHDDLVVLRFDGRKGKPLGLVVQWNCHPETLDSKNTKISSDFVGYAVRKLEKGHGCPVVYLTGTVGGLMTSLHVPIKDDKGRELSDGTFEKTQRYGELLAARASEAVKVAKPVALTPFDLRTREVFVPLTNKLYIAAAQMKVMEREAYLWKGDPARAERVDEVDPKKPMAIRTEVGHLQLGKLGVALIPGEIYPELTLGKVADPAEKGADFPDAPAEPGVYPSMPGPYRMIIGLANDEIGYILPKRQWDEKPPFAYGLKKAPYGEVNSLGPETAPVLMRAFSEMVKKK